MSTVPSGHSPQTSADAPQLVAVIDIGATSIRMAIAEIHADGHVRTLENVSQPVSLGKDTFTQRRIRKSSIERCVDVLRSYRQLLREYGITRPDAVRAVATSAVREATNRLAFLDRVYIATGLEIEPLDEAEVARITYMGIQPQLQADPNLASQRCMVIEVGGGSTEVLVVQSGNVLFSHSYRLGSLRLLKTLERFQASASRKRIIMEGQILRVVGEIREHVSTDYPLQMIGIGGDVRFAGKQLLDDSELSRLTYLSVERLNEFTRELLQMSEEEISRKYALSIQDAETVAPALLCYVLIARGFDQQEIAISGTNLRDGLLHDMAIRDVWTANFRGQIIRSAISLGRRFDFDENHARHVADLCRKLFAELQSEHQLEPRSELILYLAALLHEVGYYINARSNHKHAMYIIRNSDLFGLSRRDLLLVALVARYHRRSSPQPQHEGYATLDRDGRVTVAKLAAILRVAIALDESRSQRIQQLSCKLTKKRFIITASGVDDVSLEQLSLRQNGGLFEEVYGIPVQLRCSTERL